MPWPLPILEKMAREKVYIHTIHLQEVSISLGINFSPITSQKNSYLWTRLEEHGASQKYKL